MFYIQCKYLYLSVTNLMSIKLTSQRSFSTSRLTTFLTVHVPISSRNLQYRDISYYPPKSFALYLPTLMLGMFLSIPFFYAVLNSRAAPNFDSLDTLWDGYAKPAPIRIERHGQRASTGSTLPNIERTADL